ncbi:flavin monoamine oxidase family protein [Hyphomonas sp.]|uniref:flavin monoamine oxidase family protein n=1 Tax=Hyphomonas sp. TaxID=87 RepID=UPI00391A6998
MDLNRRKFALLSGAALLAACGPGAAPAAAPAIGRRDDADVIILGAGLSGLHAARMLADIGMKVLVLEAASRPGGRMMTLDDVPGQPEGGGQQVGQTYARIRKSALDLGIRVLPYPTRPRDAAIAVGGRIMPMADWAGAAENPLPEPYRALSPSAALLVTAGRANPFADNYAWREIAPEADVSADAFLAAQGFDGAARALIDTSLNGNSLATYSIANTWRSLTLYAEDSGLGPSERIEGGSSRLTEAMAASLPGGALLLETRIEALTERGDHVEIRAGGRTFTAPFAICSLPFPALRQVAFTAAEADPATELRRAAISGLPYTRIHQVHVIPEARYWEADGLPAEMWTDGPLERVFANYDEHGGLASLTCWINGTAADPSRNDEDWFALADAEFRRLRGSGVRGVRVVRWDETTPGAGGAYMHWAPGQIGEWAGRMGAPSGRIHFAGEHLSFLHTGMEGAMESGESAAYGVMEAAAPA